MNNFIDPLLLREEMPFVPSQLHSVPDTTWNGAFWCASDTLVKAHIGLSIPMHHFGTVTKTPKPSLGPVRYVPECHGGEDEAVCDPVTDFRGNMTRGRPLSNQPEEVGARAVLSPMAAEPKQFTPNLFPTKRGRPRKDTSTTASGTKVGVNRVPKVKYRASSSSDANLSVDDSRSRRIREKNRAAADKCRLRRRKQEDELKAKHEHMVEEHHKLSNDLSKLAEEIYGLRNMLLAHGACDCQLIQDYLKEAASTWVTRSAEESTAVRSS